MALLNQYGNPIESYTSPNKYDRPKKAPAEVVKPPRTGADFGVWANHDSYYLNMPGGAVMQFNLDKLTLTDFRSMRQNYQLGASLNVLTFLMHQLDWKIECDDQKIADSIEEDMRENWTQIVRGLSQAFWSGFAPNALNLKNGPNGQYKIDKIKDLIPEECRVEWLKSVGWAEPGRTGPTLWNYNGFRHMGYLIPPENSLWYPLLMENGDYYGRKLLKPAFPAWYFSNLMHLFANRYFERFGEPLPVGRARFEDEVNMGSTGVVSGKTAMEMVINNIRNRSVVVLPSDRDPETKEYDYDLQYLESQMRGADWERYLARLDEEMSLALFTPMLLFRTTNVGSYNLGDMHYMVFQQQLNAIAGDMQQYLQAYLVDRLRVLNFGQNSPRASWTFRKQGQANLNQFKELIVAMVNSGIAKPDYGELGAILGLKIEEIEPLVAPVNGPAGQQPAADPGKVDPKTGKPSDNPPAPVKKPTKATTKASRAVLHEAASRLAREVANGNMKPSLGYKNKFRDALVADGFDDDHAYFLTTEYYEKMNLAAENMAPVAEDAIQFKGWFDDIAETELLELV